MKSLEIPYPARALSISIPVCALALTHTGALAQDCPIGSRIASYQFSGIDHARTLDRIDAVDYLVWGGDSRVQTRDPDTFDPWEYHDMTGIPHSMTLAPWRATSSWEAVVVLSHENAYLDLVGIDQFGTFGAGFSGVYLGRGGSCVDDIAPAFLHRYEHTSDAWRALNDGLTGILYVGTRHGPECAPHDTGNKVYSVRLDDGVKLDAFNWDGTDGEVDDIQGMVLDPIEDVLYVTTEQSDALQNSLWALDVRTISPSERFSVNAGRIRAAPVLRSGRLYTVSLVDGVSARDPADGTVIWSITTPGFIPVQSNFLAPLTPPYHDALIVQDFFGDVHLARDEGSSGSWEWSAIIPGDGQPPRGLLTFDPVAGAIYAPDDSGLIYQIDAADGAIVTSFAADSTGGLPTAVQLDWPLEDGEQVEMLVATDDGTVARLCVADGGMLQNGLGPPERGEHWVGYSSYHDTDTGTSNVILHPLDVAGPTLLTFFEATATGVGPCDLGRGPTPCLEQMTFFIMGWDAGAIEGDPTDPEAPGKLFHVDVTSRLTLVRGTGYTRYGGGDLIETALLSFDLTGLGLVLPSAGGSVALMGEGSASALGELSYSFIDGGGAETDSLHVFPDDTTTPFPQTAVRVRGEPAEAADVADGVPASLQGRVHVAPHPVRTTAAVAIAGAEGDPVRIELFDAAGRRVSRIHIGHMRGPREVITWNATTVSPGIYFLRTLIGREVLTRQITRAP